RTIALDLSAPLDIQPSNVSYLDWSRCSSDHARVRASGTNWPIAAIAQNNNHMHWRLINSQAPSI
ncbi:hypothetical protein, partial [Burkholderia gladioli]